jgi:hypothetical protein
MGRPSKLSEKQWSEIGQRLLNGEKAADLAREYGVSKPVISARFSKRTETVRNVAQQILETEQALTSLPLSEQVQAVTLAGKLRSISMHMADAANYSAATTHRLAGMAHIRTQDIPDGPLTAEAKAVIQDVVALQRSANEASSIPLNLLNANKDAVKLVNQDTPVTPVKVVIQVEDASVPEPAAQ